MEKAFDQQAVTRRYQEALDNFIEQIKPDPNILAVILEGSLAYDKVWDKSDIDLVVVIKDQATETTSYCLDTDGIVINADIVTRTDFRRWVGGARGGDFTHSLLARAKVAYSTDESLTGILEDMKSLGANDRELGVLQQANHLLACMQKMEKWLVVKKDARYAQLYLLQAAGPLACLRLLLAGEMPNREAIPRAMELDPVFMAPFYERPLSGSMTQEELYNALAALNGFLTEHVDLISRPIIRLMGDGEIKTVTMLTKLLPLDSHGITIIFSFLEELGVVEKLTETIRITPKGRKLAEEVAYIYTKNLF